MSAFAPSKLGPASPLQPRVQWKWFLTAVGTLLGVYLLLLNPYWVPSGDGDVYTAIARSLAKGEGYRFNGVRAAIAPPGWPLVLAGAMKVSPTFLFLKGITIACMLGSLAITFFILRRFVSDKHSAGLVILSGVLAPLYPLTFWLHTEAFFCLLTAGAILCAFRIAERTPGPSNGYLVPDIAGMTLLLAAASFTRWPGFLHLLLVGAILLHGAPARWFERRRVTALLLATLACVVTFLGTRHYLSLTPAENRAARAAGAAEDRGDDPVAVAAAATQPATATAPATAESTQPTTAALVAAASDDNEVPQMITATADEDSSLGIVGVYLSRFVNAGRWFAWLLWYPTRFGQSVPILNAAAYALGWLAIFALLFALVAAFRQRQWFWLGLACYTGGLVMIWPNPNARYFVPVAPFILLGVVLGIQFVGRELQWSRWGRLVGGMVPVFVGSVVVTNVALLSIDVVVCRSGSRFYQTYEGGINAPLLRIARAIAADPSPRRIAASEKYVNLGKPRYSKFGIRALHLLTDQLVIPTPRRQATTGRPNRELNTWAHEKDVEYYVFQAPAEPWRLWHFRLPKWLQTKLSKTTPGPATGGWELYAWRRGRGLQGVSLPSGNEGVTRVPGM